MNDLTPRLNKAVGTFYRKIFLSSLRNLGRIPFFLRVMGDQRKAALKRRRFASEKLHVPPFLIASLTEECNLKCAGCYSKILRKKNSVLTAGKWSALFKEADELGISTTLLAGGEPFLRLDVLKAAAERKSMIHAVFTNGLCINNKILDWLEKNRNIIPVLSLEGDAETTDKRRGKGTYRHVTSVLHEMRNRGIFAGMSITVTRQNFDPATNEAMIRNLVQLGAGLFIMVEYVPVDGKTSGLVLTNDQKSGLISRCVDLQKKCHVLFVAFPGDETKWGGCLAAGRGFIHISSQGKLEACPFAPFSDTDLSHSSLRKALGSPLMKAIRDNHHLLTETAGGCALWSNRLKIPALLHY
jgi:MoaA/NifB/PqqE/SkfB family radical SAM enzyme